METSLPLREVLLQHAAQPEIARILTMAGVCGIVTEFLRPGSVLPGAIGVTLVLVGIRNTPFDSALIIPLLISATVLLSIAMRARRNKLATVTLVTGKQE